MNENNTFYQPIRVNREKPWATWTILGINVAIYLIMNLWGMIVGAGTNTQLLLFGAKVNELIAMGQYWRLISANFLHIDVAHLFFNMLALYFYGPVTEMLFGRKKFVALYMLAGLLGSIASFAFNVSASAGASGAIFGIIGAMFYFRKMRPDIFKRMFGARLFIILGINIFYGLSNSAIDNWGHFGGFVGGFLAAYALGLFGEQHSTKKVGAWAVLFVLLAAGIFIGLAKVTI